MGAIQRSLPIPYGKTVRIVKRLEGRRVRRLYWLAFGFRFGAGVTAWVLTQFFQLPFMQDALQYEHLGAALAADWLAGRQSVWLTQAMESGVHAWGIVVLIGAFYVVTGGLRLVPVLLAVYSAITACTPVLTYRIARRLGAPTRGALIGALLVALSPGFAFWSGALYKEGLILLLLNLAVYHALRLQQRLRWWSMATLAASVMALFSLRCYLAVMLGPALGVALMLGRSRGRARGESPLLLVRQTALVALFVAVMVTVGFTGRAQHVAPASFDAGLEKLHISRKDLAGANSGYLSEVDVSTPARAVAFLPVGLVYFLTLPLPWQIGPLRQNLVIPETLLWILLYPLVAVGAKEALKKNFQGASLILLVTGAMCALYALLSGNVGVTYRMRIQVWLLWAVFAGWGWQIWSQRRGRGHARRGVVRRFPARSRNSDGGAETLGRDRERLPLR